jgi:hypothetical protein
MGDLVDLGAQVPVLVEIPDDLLPDAANDRILGGEAQLLVEVLA